MLDSFSDLNGIIWSFIEDFYNGLPLDIQVILSKNVGTVLDIQFTFLEVLRLGFFALVYYLIFKGFIYVFKFFATIGKGVLKK